LRLAPDTASGRSQGHDRPPLAWLDAGLTVGADKGYDTTDFVADLWSICVTTMFCKR
jgi:hypothetical protein